MRAITEALSARRHYLWFDLNYLSNSLLVQELTGSNALGLHPLVFVRKIHPIFQRQYMKPIHMMYSYVQFLLKMTCDIARQALVV